MTRLWTRGVLVALVLLIGVAIGLVATRPASSGGSVHSGSVLPSLSTVTFTPETLYVPPALPGTTTTTRPPTQRVTVKNVTRNVTRDNTINRTVTTQPGH